MRNAQKSNRGSFHFVRDDNQFFAHVYGTTEQLAEKAGAALLE
jgi:hypothetical protein